MNRLYRRIREKRGFTLIELLIVIIILAVLAAIAVPTYLTMRDRAREAGTEAEMANIATALELYRADNESYPKADGWREALKDGDYMNNVPNNDMWGRIYKYEIIDNGGYVLTSQGINEGNDTDDIIFSNGQQTGFGKYNTNIR